MTILFATEFDLASLRKTIDAFRSAGTRAPTADFDVPTDLATAEPFQRSASVSGDFSDACRVAKSPTGVPIASRLHPFILSRSGQALSWRSGTSLEIEVAVSLKQDLVPGPQYDRVDIVDTSEPYFRSAQRRVGPVLSPDKP